MKLLATYREFQDAVDGALALSKGRNSEVYVQETESGEFEVLYEDLDWGFTGYEETCEVELVAIALTGNLTFSSLHHA